MPKSFLRQILQDKDGVYSLRKIILLLFTVSVIISWIAAQFFDFPVPQYIFEALVSLVKNEP